MGYVATIFFVPQFHLLMYCYSHVFFRPLLFLFLLSVLRFFLSLFSTLGLFFW